MSNTMREQLEQRLQELKEEFQKGQQMLMEAEERCKTIKDSLLRINGAIQVLEEELAKEADNNETPEKTGNKN